MPRLLHALLADAMCVVCTAHNIIGDEAASMQPCRHDDELLPGAMVCGRMGKLFAPARSCQRMEAMALVQSSRYLTMNTLRSPEERRNVDLDNKKNRSGNGAPGATMAWSNKSEEPLWLLEAAARSPGLTLGADFGAMVVKMHTERLGGAGATVALSTLGMAVGVLVAMSCLLRFAFAEEKVATSSKAQAPSRSSGHVSKGARSNARAGPVTSEGASASFFRGSNATADIGMPQPLSQGLVVPKESQVSLILPLVSRDMPAFDLTDKEGNVILKVKLTRDKASTSSTTRATSVVLTSSRSEPMGTCVLSRHLPGGYQEYSIQRPSGELVATLTRRENADEFMVSTMQGPKLRFRGDIHRSSVDIMECKADVESQAHKERFVGYTEPCNVDFDHSGDYVHVLVGPETDAGLVVCGLLCVYYLGEGPTEVGAAAAQSSA